MIPQEMRMRSSAGKAFELLRVESQILKLNAIFRTQ